MDFDADDLPADDLPADDPEADDPPNELPVTQTINRGGRPKGSTNASIMQVYVQKN
jgi:hypothetical protein